MHLQRIVAASLLALGITSAFAAEHSPEPAEKSPGLHLEATASSEVTEDTAWANLAVEQSAKDAATAQRQTSEGLARVLDTVKHTTHLQAKTAGFYTSPVYAADGRITSWRSRAELHIESAETQLVAKTAADLSPVARVEGVGFYLSAAARAAAEQSLIASAVKDFGEKANVTAHALGYARTTLRDVAISQQGGEMPRPMMATAMKAARADSAPGAPVPMEPGKTQVSVTVSGTVGLEN